MTQRSTASLVLVAVLLAPNEFAQVNAAATACKTLADKDNTFYTALVQMQALSDATLSDMPLEQVFAPVNTNLPWLSQCVAAIDPLAVVTQVMTSTTLTGCLKTLNATVMPQEMTSNAFKETICPLYNDTIIPCVRDGVVDLAMRTLTSATGGCCDAFAAKITESFGNNMTRMADLLLQYVGNVICAQKSTTGTTGSTAQYCGASWMGAFNSSQVDMLAMVNFAQVPTAQVCDAMTGSTFLSTLGVKTKLPLTTSADIGICFQPVDLLLQHLRDYPIMKSYVMVTGAQTASVPLSNLFATDKCIPGDALIDWLVLPANPLLTYVGVYDAFMTAYVSHSPATPTNSPSDDGGDLYAQTNLTTILSSTLAAWRSAAKAFCFHLPTGATCAYSGQQVTYPYTEAGPQVSTLAANSLAPGSQRLWVSALMVVLAIVPLVWTSS